MHRSSETDRQYLRRARQSAGGAEPIRRNRSLASFGPPFRAKPIAVFAMPRCRAGWTSSRKSLGRHEIATIQSTEIDKEAGLLSAHDRSRAFVGRMDFLGMAGVPDLRYHRGTAHGRGADLRPAVCPFRAGGHCRRGRSRCAGSRSRFKSRSGPAATTGASGSAHSATLPRPTASQVAMGSFQGLAPGPSLESSCRQAFAKA